MLYSAVYIKLDPQPSPSHHNPSATPAPCSAPNSHGITSLADPHPLTPIESYRSIKQGGGGEIPSCCSPDLQFTRINSFLFNYLRTLVLISGRTENSNPFFSIVCVLFAKTTRGGGYPFLSQNLLFAARRENSIMISHKFRLRTHRSSASATSESLAFRHVLVVSSQRPIKESLHD